MGKGKGSKDYPKEPKDGETGKLKKRIAKLEKENAVLKSQLRTYDNAFHRNIMFLKGKVNDLSLDELIKGAQEEMTLNEIKNEKVYTFEKLKEKWQCYECREGVMKIMVIPGNRYFRKCTMCMHRTEAQVYDDLDSIEGIK